MKRIGDMRRRGIVEARIREDDGTGGWREVWTEWGTVWLEFTPLSGPERVQAMAHSLEVVGTVRIRYSATIPSPVRFLVSGRVLEQVGAPRDMEDRRRWLIFDVRERNVDYVEAES